MHDARIVVQNEADATRTTGLVEAFRPLYETEVTDEMRVAYGRGPTAEASIQAAQRNWDAQFEITCWGTTQTTLTFEFYLRQHRCVLAGRLAAEGLVPRPRGA